MTFSQSRWGAPTTTPPAVPPPPAWNPNAPIGTDGLCGVGHKWCTAWMPTVGAGAPHCGFTPPTTWASGPNPAGTGTGGGPATCTYSADVCRGVSRTCTFLLGGGAWTETSTECYKFVTIPACTPLTSPGPTPPLGTTFCPTTPNCVTRTQWCWMPADGPRWVN